MDINYLLLLQDFRNGIDNALTPFMEMISLFAVTYLIIVPALVYWCVDKRAGLYTLGSYGLSVTVNVLIKLSCCVYRPWIRDPRILPAGDSITTATGYSFPSGHTMTAVPIYGCFAVSAWKKMRWVSVLCLICIALTGFSRNYLGVHTPQDVLVGLLAGFLVVWGMSALFRWLEKHPEKENWFLLGGVLLSIGAIVYFSLKQYPMDYQDGKLLVDPQKMMKDGFGDTARLFAFCVGRFIEKKWIRFRPDFSRRSLAAGLAGAVLLFFIIETVGAPMKALFGLHWGAFFQNLISFMFIMCIWPLVMKKCSRRAEAPEAPEAQAA
jgi:membrane-associated phospholipid phosphatase